MSPHIGPRLEVIKPCPGRLLPDEVPVALQLHQGDLAAKLEMRLILIVVTLPCLRELRVVIVAAFADGTAVGLQKYN